MRRPDPDEPREMGLFEQWMPVLLMPDEYDRWLNGTFDDACAFQDRCFPDDLIVMHRTAEPWIKRANRSSGGQLLL